MERDAREVCVALADGRVESDVRRRSVRRPDGDESEAGLRLASTELQVEVVNPYLTGIHHQPRLADNKEALVWLQRQQVIGDVPGEVQRIHWIRA